MRASGKTWLAAFVAGTSVAIGIEPLIWLVKAQASPAQAPAAVLRIALLGLLVTWSATSRATAPRGTGANFGLAMLVAALVARLVGLILGVKHIGAVALVCDVYAGAWLLGLPGRKRGLSPFFLALAASLCLPLDRPLYRLLGYPAQLAGLLLSGRRLAPEPLIDGLLCFAFAALLLAATRVRGQTTPGPRLLRLRVLVPAAALCSAALLAACHMRPAPVDRSAALPAPWLPPSFRGSSLEPLALDTTERSFFAAVGGNAAKGRYGQLSVLVIVSSSPLRHLHAPTWCLAGLGHRLELVAYHGGRIPLARYSAEAPDGTRYEVQSTFVSSRGHAVAEVSEAIWLWLFDPTLVWRSVQVFGPPTASNGLAAVAEPRRAPAAQDLAQTLLDADAL